MPVAEELWRKNLGRPVSLNLTGPRERAWWTGPVPKGTLRALPIPDLSRCSRAEVLAYFDNGWALTEVLFSALQGDEAFYRPPRHGLRHPMIFYYAHPAALYVNKLRVAGLLESPLNAYYESLFETGVDEMSWDDLSKNEMEWPTVDEVHAYRREVYRLVRGVIERHPGLADGHPRVGQDSPLWALFMGFEHERIHLETSSVLIRELPLPLVRRPEQWPQNAPATAAEPNVFVQHGADKVVVGKPSEFPTWGWDNEYGHRESSVAAFGATRAPVGNAEFLEFVADGGYAEERFWTRDGWKWRRFRNAKWPCFWVPDGPAGLNRYKLRTCFEELPLPPSWPAVVNFHEAKAYCAWRAERDGADAPYRLLTEAEHHRLRRDGDLAAANLALRHGSEGPVDGNAFGNVWQWCEDHFNPLPGFEVHRYYDDFSTPCFDGKHQMILGGSFVSAGDEATAHARFHFRPHFFQHAGFRMVRAAGDGAAARLDRADGADKYESRALLDQYLLLHFGTAEEALPGGAGPKDAARFPERCAEAVEAWRAKLGLPAGRALDVGCAVGGATFALARTFDEAIGVDLSAAFIEAAQEIKEKGRLAYARRESGERLTPLVARVVDDGARARARFRQADACSLPAEYKDFDAVLAANLLCRIPSPMSFLSRMGGPRGLVKRGGLLVLTTPFSWSEAFTPRSLWLDEDGLAAALAPEFERLERRDFPCLIREHARKFEYILPLLTVWRRR